MDRSYASGAAGIAPVAPASPSIGYPTAGNPGTGTPATKPGPYWYHQITEELMAIITAAGISPAHGVLTQLASAIQSGKLFSSAAAGTADAITAAFSPAIADLTNGLLVCVKASAANSTAAPTLKVDGTAALGIVKGDNRPLELGDIPGAGYWANFQYNLTLNKWVLLNPATGLSTASSASVQGVFKNLQISAGGTAASISASFDELVLGDGNGSYVTERNVAGTITTTNTGAGGLDTGVLAVSAWYSIWRIGKTDGTRAWLFSLSATAPTMPVGYTLKARIGWFRTDATNKYPLSFKQFGRSVQYIPAAGSNLLSLPVVISGVQGVPATPTFVSGALTNFVPSTAARFKGLWNGNSDTGTAIVAPNNAYGGSGASGNGKRPWVNINGAQDTYGGTYTMPFDMLIESMNIYYAATGASNNVQCIGWEDNI